MLNRRQLFSTIIHHQHFENHFFSTPLTTKPTRLALCKVISRIRFFSACRFVLCIEACASEKSSNAPAASVSSRTRQHKRTRQGNCFIVSPLRSIAVSPEDRLLLKPRTPHHRSARHVQVELDSSLSVAFCCGGAQHDSALVREYSFII